MKAGHIVLVVVLMLAGAGVVGFHAQAWLSEHEECHYCEKVEHRGELSLQRRVRVLPRLGSAGSPFLASVSTDFVRSHDECYPAEDCPQGCLGGYVVKGTKLKVETKIKRVRAPSPGSREWYTNASGLGRDNMVRLLAAGGEMCGCFGHKWKTYRYWGQPFKCLFCSESKPELTPLVVAHTNRVTNIACFAGTSHWGWASVSNSISCCDED